MAKRIGVYPGTFDPVTNGHMDIIRRASLLADQLIIAVSTNAGKGPLLTIGERMSLMEAELADPRNGLEHGRIELRAFDNLLMHFVEEMGAHFIIRGLRAVSDFEYEFQMAGMNARLDPNVETVFLMASERQQFISSRFIKEIGRLGGRIDEFVSPRVNDYLKKIFSDGR
ncbi:pantetheine-phosphate adenylyltransferase [Dongia sp.]|uniref:pantetheine-phosphate adenylyltransferase n=1 Tax=Dongia sp. TaxID=1977262 RepID=UPI0035B37341